MSILTSLLDKVYSERKSHAREYLAKGGNPLLYWASLDRSGVSYMVTELNSEPLIPEIQISVNSEYGGVREHLLFSVDGSSLYKVLKSGAVEICTLDDSNLLFLVRSLYTAIAENERTLGEEDIAIKIPRTRIEHNRD